jgi:type II secretory pathway pseudopilin PulG
MHTRTPPGSNDAGETLIELIMAVAIMGIAVVAVVGGIATSILMSDIHRKQATAGAYVRNYAEAVVAYVAAGTPAANANFASPSPDYSASAVGFTAPAGGFVASVTSVRCWQDGSQLFASCTAASAVQQVTLNIASSDSRASEALLVIVRKP